LYVLKKSNYIGFVEDVPEVEEAGTAEQNKNNNVEQSKITQNGKPKKTDAVK